MPALAARDNPLTPSVLMADPNWNRGFYYDGVPPHNGMKLARQIATITYRSGPEWETRFGRRMLSEKEEDVPRLSPDFLIETYLDHQVGWAGCTGTCTCISPQTLGLVHRHFPAPVADMRRSRESASASHTTPTP
jgi:hypothetical protein